MTTPQPPEASESGVDVEDLASGVRVLTLRNPRRRNALDEAMLSAFERALEVPAQTRCLLVRGDGAQAFCAGYDLTSLGEPEGGALPDDHLLDVLDRLEQHPLPSIALVTGAAFGAGCDLASACDLRIGSAQGFFCMPPAKLGVVYAEGGLSRLLRAIGPSRAKWMFLSGRKVEAERALEWGLLDELYPTAAEADAAARALAEELCANAPLAVQGMKRGLGFIARRQLGPEQRAQHRAARLRAYLSADAKEGKASFAEKRRPTFRGE